MAYYVNYLDEKFEVQQEVLSKKCEAIFDSISSLEGFRTRICDSNKTAVIGYPIFFLLGAIIIIIANLFLLKQGENFIFNMILSYHESVGNTASISSHVYININTINSGNKPLHFQKLDS